MSPDPEDTTPAAPDRREAVREKAQSVQLRQTRMRWLRRAGLTAGAVAAVAAVATVVVWSVMSAVSKPELTPGNVNADGFTVSAVAGALTAEASLSAEAATPTPTPTPSAAAAEASPAAAPVDIRVYVDYLSPGAGEWHLANVKQLGVWVDQGAATLSYHPVSMLTAKSNGTKYSLRAAGAAACVATHSPDAFFAFNADLLTRQPAVDSDGYSNDELADIAQAVGATEPKLVRECIEDGDFIEWAKDATERAVAGIPNTDDLALTGTPTIVVNGQPYMGALSDPAEFSQFVLTTASDSFYKSQATPSPTPTAPAPTAKPSTTPKP